MPQLSLIVTIFCRLVALKSHFINIFYFFLFDPSPGGSFHSSLYSTDVDQDIRHSDLTASASALSSHGSFSESNLSQEYMPLDSSPKTNSPSTATTTDTNTSTQEAAPEGWTRFEVGKKTPSPTKSNIYFVGTTKPGHTRSQSAGGPFGMDVFSNGNDNRRRASSTLTSHLEDHVTPSPTASPPVPRQQNHIKQNNGYHQTSNRPRHNNVQQHVMLPSPSSPPSIQANNSAQVASKNATNLHQLSHSQLLQHQQILLHQQQQLKNQLQKQKLAAAAGGQLHQIQEQQLIPTSLSVKSQSVSSMSSSSPVISPGNPFKEDIFKQLQPNHSLLFPIVSKTTTVNDVNITPRSAASSPFNPFKRTDSIKRDSGTVVTSATWESFADPKNNKKLPANSQGNPFKQMMITANVHPSHSQSEPLVYEASPKHVVVPEIKTVTDNSKLHQEATQSPKVLNLTDKLETPKVLNNQISATSQSVPSQSVPSQSNVDTIVDAGVSPTSPQQQEEDTTSPYIDEYPRGEVDPTDGWPLMLRCPDKKKLTGSRYWKPVHICLKDGNVIQIFDDRTRKEPFRELPLQSNYDFGDRRLQAYDISGKIHTIKLFYVSYKEKKRMGAFEEMEKVLKMEPLIKLGSTNHDVFRSFIHSVNDALMKLTAFRDRGRHYEQELVTVTVTDDYRGYIDYSGEVLKQSITTDLNILAFLSGMPKCSLGLNDAENKTDEIVPRRDIIPNRTDHWIKFENMKLHKCVNKNVFSESRFLEFSPLDGCRFNLLQFRTRPKDKELPMYVKVKVSGEKKHIDMRTDLYLPGECLKGHVVITFSQH